MPISMGNALCSSFSGMGWRGLGMMNSGFLRALLTVLGAGCMMGVAAGQGLPPAQETRTAPVMLPPLAVSPADLAGGVAPAKPSGAAVQLSLDDAIQLGLRNNLGPLLASSANQQARAQRLTALAALLPRADASAGEMREKVNLAAFGLSLPGIPLIVGPFNVFQASVAASVPVLNLGAWENLRASRSLAEAAQANYEATRNLVVLA